MKECVSLAQEKKMEKKMLPLHSNNKPSPWLFSNTDILLLMSDEYVLIFNSLCLTKLWNSKIFLVTQGYGA